MAPVMMVVVYQWNEAVKRNRSQEAEPFRIAGNFYYVGMTDVTAFLITGPEGHVLIDGGYPESAKQIMASIAKLGFNIADVKVLLNSHAHGEHVGGLAELQNVSGASLFISEPDADVVAAGGPGASWLFPLARAGTFPHLKFPAPRVDHRFEDGATIRVGPIELTAHITGIHTPGCTTWTFPVTDGDRVLNVVHRCDIGPPSSLYLLRETRPDYERALESLRNLPVDIWVTSHAREFGRWRKYQESLTARNPVEAFIDRQGYLDSIDRAEEAYRKLLGESR